MPSTKPPELLPMSKGSLHHKAPFANRNLANKRSLLIRSAQRRKKTQSREGKTVHKIGLKKSIAHNEAMELVRS
jgi:hypothetical protein